LGASLQAQKPGFPDGGDETLPASYHLTLYGEPLSPDHWRIAATVAGHAIKT
jgi:hypothetical protein